MTRKLIHFTDSISFGGAEQAMLHLLRGLDRRRWRPVVMHHPEARASELLDRARSLDIELIEIPPMPLGTEGAIRIPSLVRRLRAERPDAFHAHLSWPLACKWALVSAMAARVPAIFATCHLFVDAPYSRTTRFQQRLLTRGIDRCITVSHEVARRLRTVFGVPDDKLRVVHNAVPYEDFSWQSDAHLRGQLTQGDDRPIVFTCARFDEQKGHRYLLEAAVDVPGAVFVLAGEGIEQRGLEAQAEALGIRERVLFLGHRHDVPALLASSDLFVLPSLYEGLPLSVLEAMASGKPVIASAIGGTDEAIVDGETGVLVPPADPYALANAINSLLSDRARARDLALAGQVRAREAFTIESMVRGVEDVYDEVFAARETGG